jgi:hypothetical protein
MLDELKRKLAAAVSMKKHQLDHVLRAAGRITGQKQFVIIGSQSLHGKYPDLPDEIVTSAERTSISIARSRSAAS